METHQPFKDINPIYRKNELNYMNGRVKSFSEDKGYGFLIDSEGEVRYFSASGICGAESIQPGTAVSFDPTDAGTIAVNVQSLRSTCKNCNNEVVPKVSLQSRLHSPITYSSDWDQEVMRFECPLCGEFFQVLPLHDHSRRFAFKITIVICAVFFVFFLVFFLIGNLLGW